MNLFALFYKHNSSVIYVIYNNRTQLRLKCWLCLWSFEHQVLLWSWIKRQRAKWFPSARGTNHPHLWGELGLLQSVCQTRHRWCLIHELEFLLFLSAINDIKCLGMLIYNNFIIWFHWRIWTWLFSLYTTPSVWIWCYRGPPIERFFLILNFVLWLTRGISVHIRMCLLFIKYCTKLTPCSDVLGRQWKALIGGCGLLEVCRLSMRLVSGPQWIQPW